MVLSTSPAASYNRSQVVGGEYPFGLPWLDPCLQPQQLPTAHSVEVIQTKLNLANQAKNPRIEHCN
ncbi:hypothetical protein NC652_041153 [Populus alba x Populus x berolinensis]|nr:hypothetical protein NC652_041153 [Populus alba x Populus x berolinensis]